MVKLHSLEKLACFMWTAKIL